jgi:hypothetical protein
MSRITLELHSERDIMLLLALAERLNAFNVTVTELLPKSPVTPAPTPTGNYNKQALLAAFQQAQQKQVFKNITNAMIWQQNLRNEWEERITR